MAAPKPPGPPKPPSLGVNNEFDLARRRAQQQESQNLGAQKDALARRAAQLGGGVSGALIKQEQIATDESAKRLGQANEGIDAARMQEQRRLDEIAQGQDFARSEREATQAFAAGESALARRLAEAGLTGVYGGKKTLAAQQFEKQTALAEAGLTGKYNGADTLAGKTYADAKTQNDFENRVNVGTLLATQIGNWKTQGLKPGEIQSRLDALFGGMDLGSLGIDMESLLSSYDRPIAQEAQNAQIQQGVDAKLRERKPARPSVR
jgi:hypothetical protein